MKKLAIRTAIASLMGAATLMPAMAQAEVSANAAVTSNYLWRGLEQTDGGPAVQAGVDYSHESGFYVGTWASNVDFGDADIELDLYGGYAGTAGEWEYDVGYVMFLYPGSNADFDFGEIYGNFTKGALTLGVATLANAEGADFGDSLYLSADYGFALPQDIELALHVGSYTGDFVGEDAIDFGISASKSGFTLGVTKVSQDGGDEDVKFYASYARDFAL